MTQEELLEEHRLAREALTKVEHKLKDHFGPLVDAAIAAGDKQRANSILWEVPESWVRFLLWKTIEQMEIK